MNGERAHHPSTQAILRFFAYGHLPEPLQQVSKPFHDLAYKIADQLDPDPELAVALRKLRESKDCAVGLAAQSLR